MPLARAPLVLVLLAGHALAQPAAAPSPTPRACDAAELDELRAHLASESGKADTWNLAWRIAFTGAAVGTLAVGVWNPFPTLREGLYASSGKAAIGALARWILPLRIHVPEATGDACVDLALVRKEIARVAKKERGLFWMGHFGGIAVNLGGAAYVWYRDSFNKAMLSIAVGYPVGVLSNYTMPRGTWKLHRAQSVTWTALTMPLDDGWQLAIAGAF